MPPMTVFDRIKAEEWFKALAADMQAHLLQCMTVDPKIQDRVEKIFVKLDSEWKGLSQEQRSAQVRNLIELECELRLAQEGLPRSWSGTRSWNPTDQARVRATMEMNKRIQKGTRRPATAADEKEIAASSPWAALLGLDSKRARTGGREDSTMFRQIANQNGTTAQLIRAHPARLAAVLEAYWHRVNIPVGFPGQVVSPPAPDPTFPYGLESVASTAAGWNPWRPRRPPGPAVPQPPPGIGWNHLIYAYMIENTRVFEIFERVLARVRARRAARDPRRGDPAVAAGHARSCSISPPSPFRLAHLDEPTAAGRTAPRGATRTTGCSGWT